MKKHFIYWVICSICLILQGCGTSVTQTGSSQDLPVNINNLLTLKHLVLDIKIGEELQQVVSSGSVDITSQTVWSIANPKIVSISSHGYFRGLAIGSTTVTASSVTDPNKYAICQVNVLAIGEIVTGNPQAERFFAVSPNRTPVFISGQTYKLYWNCPFDPNTHVRIDLYRNNTRESIITNDLSKTNMFLWSVPTSIIKGYGYKIRIANVAKAYEYFETEQTYDIYRTDGAPPLRLVSPNGGETLITGNTYVIQWNCPSTANARVNIFLHKDNIFYKQIASDITNTGNFNWQIPEDFPLGNQYTFKIFDTISSEFDFSDDAFAITGSGN